MPAVRIVEAAHVGHPAGVDPHILGMEVEEFSPKLVERGQRVHALDDEVRRIVVEPERGRIDVGEGPAPDRRRRQQIFSTGPLISSEQHRTVLDADPHAVVLRMLHQRLPGLEEPWPVVVDRLRPVAAYESVDGVEAEQGGGGDQFSKMGSCRLCDGGIGVEHVRVEAEPADRDAVPLAGRADVVRHRGRERGDVYVRDARILPLGRPHRPAHQFDAGKALGGGEGQHRVEGEFGKDCRHEAELQGHETTSGGVSGPR